MKIGDIKINVDTTPLDEALSNLKRALLMTSILSQIGSEVMAPVERERPTKLENAVEVMAGTIRTLLERDDLDEPAFAVHRPRASGDEVIEIGDKFVICDLDGLPTPYWGGSQVGDIITVTRNLGIAVRYVAPSGQDVCIKINRLTRYIP